MNEISVHICRQISHFFSSNHEEIGHRHVGFSREGGLETPDQARPDQPRDLNSSTNQWLEQKDTLNGKSLRKRSEFI